MTLEHRAETRRRRAHDLLAELRLEERLATLGEVEVEVTGSVRHGLVVAHDIDVDVDTAALDVPAAFAAVGEIASSPLVARVIYRNVVEMFGGLSFDIVCRLADGEEWTIELYVNGPEASTLGWTAELARVFDTVLTPEHRHAILELKEALVQDPAYCSFDVYRAVLDGGVRTLQEFLPWRDEHGSAEVFRWIPKAYGQA